jgi:hypothetical protein
LIIFYIFPGDWPTSFIKDPQWLSYWSVEHLSNFSMILSVISDARQREDSERFFIRYYANAEKKPLIYDQLVAEHGILEQLVKVDLTPKKYAKVRKKL